MSTSTPLVITAADQAYFALVRGTIRSIRDQPRGRDVAIAFIDLGCSDEQLAWLRAAVDVVRPAAWALDFPTQDRTPAHARGLLARPFLRRWFPGHDLYLWIDADAWVQDWSAVDLLLQGAARRGLAIVPELDRGSRLQYGGLPAYWQFARRQYAAAFGPELAARLHHHPMLNAGVFALRADAPHWDVWAACLRQALQRPWTILSDQLALNVAVYERGLFPHTELLPAWCNWTTHYGWPARSGRRGRWVEPYLPHHPIGVLHLTDRKQDQVAVTTSDGGRLSVPTTYPRADESVRDAGAESGADPFPPGDYVAPGMVLVRPDAYFPHLAIGDRAQCAWPHLRRQVPHNWYTDRRCPGIGFLNRDEAHILYNTALQFGGRRALEIGCWLGWSTCHLALAGVRLDVVDPQLASPDVHQSVTTSLRAAAVMDAVSLTAGTSPAAVEKLADVNGRGWSLMFIDGSHAAPGPRLDAEVCARHAEPDALMLFHDLACPDVAEGLDCLRSAGWHTVVYQTMQIMGAAWRGNVAPVEHEPDARVDWTLPDHLREHPVSGVAGAV